MQAGLLALLTGHTGTLAHWRHWGRAKLTACIAVEWLRLSRLFGAYIIILGPQNRIIARLVFPQHEMALNNEKNYQRHPASQLIDRNIVKKESEGSDLGF
jgi:hypothetical protein